MVTFYTSFENIFDANLSLIRPIEPVIDENHSELEGWYPSTSVPELIIEVSGVRGYLEA